MASTGPWRRGRPGQVAVGVPADLPLSSVPDKRQESKQRRAARNRANREALAARREAAQATPGFGGSDRSGASSTSARATAGRNTAAGGATASASEPAPRNLKELVRSRRTGDRAVLAAFGLALAAAIYLPFFYRVRVDDRGEPLPVTFRALAISIRERVTGQGLPETYESLIEASGPSILIAVVLPVAVTLFAVWAALRPDRSRMLTFAMLAMAGAVVLTGGIGIFFFPALIALAVGGFRVRKADLPARAAERTTGGGGGLFGGGGGGLFGRPRPGGAIDAESTEVTGDRRGPADKDGGDGPGEADPLADLETELAAEDEPEGRDADDGRRRRR
jgi:hypothetical protein